MAFDPHRGRLWTVCPGCSRWNLTPLEDRWETLEACEEAARARGTVLLRSPHLSLLKVGEGELIRVGRSPRAEFVDWRYGSRSGRPESPPGFWARTLGRLLAHLPEPPPEGYDPYRGAFGVFDPSPWLASPFLASASSLTYLFSQLPLASGCPSCRRPLALRPWDFQRVGLTGHGGTAEVMAPCAFCGTEVVVPLQEARPVLRLGLGLVTPPPLLRSLSGPAALRLDRFGEPRAFLHLLAREEASLGGMTLPDRAALLIALDEGAETDALEAEWREAEELAAISDGELSEVPGFEEFRREILGSED